MNEVTPPWRAFSSEAPAPDGSASQEPAAGRRYPFPRWLVPLLATFGGLAAGAALAVVGALSLGLSTAPGEAPPLGQPLSAGSGFEVSTQPTEPNADIIVDVAGAVARPGLHRLRSGERVGDAIEAAGGFAPRADLAAASQTLNLAQPLEDGTKVLVPELGIDRPAAAAAAADDGRVDLNRASQSELESLPGIGPVTAGKIIDAREDERFGRVRELRSRGLVGESVYGDIEDLVRAG